MDITPLIKVGQQIIKSYGNGVFKVSSISYDHPICVTPEKTSMWAIGTAKQVSELSLEHFDILIKQADIIDVVILGSGAKMVFMPRDLKKYLKESGLSVDIMDTGAACRTYNVLMAEGRRVACLLLPFKE